jgi:putative transposase
MGSRGDHYDNAVADSFFTLLNKEAIHRHGWTDREELRRGSSSTSRSSTTPRRHSTIETLSPRGMKRDIAEQLNNQGQ